MDQSPVAARTGLLHEERPRRGLRRAPFPTVTPHQCLLRPPSPRWQDSRSPSVSLLLRCYIHFPLKTRKALAGCSAGRALARGVKGPGLGAVRGAPPLQAQSPPDQSLCLSHIRVSSRFSPLPLALSINGKTSSGRMKSHSQAGPPPASSTCLSSSRAHILLSQTNIS